MLREELVQGSRVPVHIGPEATMVDYLGAFINTNYEPSTAAYEALKIHDPDSLLYTVEDALKVYPSESPWLHAFADEVAHRALRMESKSRKPKRKLREGMYESLENGRVVAKWESKTGKHWVVLYRDDYGYGYTSPDAGGFLGQLPSDEDAIAQMEAKIETGYFLPDSAKTPMRRVESKRPKARSLKESGPWWEYEDARGVTVRGKVENFVDFGGTDQTYYMRREDGTLDLLSGSRLKAARVIYDESRRSR